MPLTVWSKFQHKPFQECLLYELMFHVNTIRVCKWNFVYKIPDTTSKALQEKACFPESLQTLVESFIGIRFK